MTDTIASAAPLQAAAGLIRDAHRIVVVSHVNPDADAIGAIVGATRSLRALGKDVVPVLADAVPAYARFLPGTETVLTELPDGNPDLYLFADSAGIDRVGSLYEADPERFSDVPLVNVDHHGTNPLYGTVNYVDGHASSTSELVYRLLSVLEAPIDAPTATALLFGIVGDTGSFRNGATTPGALEAAAQLLRLGADTQTIAFQLFESKTFEAARTWGRVLDRIERDAGRGVVFGCLSAQVLREEGAMPEEAEGLVEYLRGIEGTRVAVLLKENDDGDIRVSMRSRPGEGQEPAVDVAAIATLLGGGGHRQAAGCTLPGPFASAQQAIVDAFDRLNPGG